MASGGDLGTRRLQVSLSVHLSDESSKEFPVAMLAAHFSSCGAVSNLRAVNYWVHYGTLQGL